MDYGKALRHLIAAEMRAAAGDLSARGLDAGARRLEALSRMVTFESEPNEHRLAIRAAADGKPPVEIVRPLEDFQFYEWKEGVPGAGDPVQLRNRAAARSVIKEVLEKFDPSQLQGPLLEFLDKGPVPAAPPAAGRKFPLADVLAASVLAAAAFAAAWWSSRRTYDLIDMTYLIENASRIKQGEVPYRDFVLVLPPLHYYIQAAVLSVAGNCAFAFLLTGCAFSALTTFLTYWLCRQLDAPLWVAALASAVTLFNGAGVLGFSSYDSDATIFFCIGLGLLLLWERRGYKFPLGFAAGACLAAVTLCKLNMGLPLLLGLALALALAKLLYGRFTFAAMLTPLAGAAAVLAAFGLWLQINGARSDFVEQCVRGPAAARLNFFHNLWAAVTPKWLVVDLANLRFKGIWRLIVTIGCLLPFCEWATGIHRRPVRFFLLVPLMGFVLGAMQSQSYGSTYGIVPVAALILVRARAFLRPLAARLADVLFCLTAAAFIVMSFSYVYRGERLGFMNRPLEDPAPFRLKSMQGLYVTREYRDAFEHMIADSERLIGAGESVFYLPGDLPYYFVSGHRCPLRNIQVENSTTGMSTEQCTVALDKANVKWLIVRHKILQDKTDIFKSYPPLNDWLNSRYDKVLEHGAFLFFKRKSL